MKICFINPAPRSYVIERGHETSGAYPPLGSLYIIAYLRQQGHECILLDQHATKIPTSRLLEQVKKYDPFVVAFNSLTDINHGKRSTFIAQKVKAWNPNVKIIFGNCHATFNHDRILAKYPFVDVCVRGEGELTTSELISAFEHNRELTNVLGITYRDKGNIRVNPDRPLIQDLDQMPFPDRSVLGNIKYFQNYGGLNADYGKFTSIQSSRGCPYNCTFCCQSHISQRKWRPRSIPKVIEELHQLESEGYTNLYWVDDNFTINRKRAIQLFQAMRREKFDFVWVCDQRVDLVTTELLQEMRRAGCHTLSFGIESANQRILNFFNKGFTPQIARTATMKAKKVGFDFTMGTFVVGAPTETLEEIKNTFVFAQTLGIDFPQFHIYGAIPGTDVWDKLVEEGTIDPEKYWENGVKTLVLPLEVVEKEMKKAYYQFITRPRFIFNQLLRTLKSHHRRKIIQSNLKVLGSPQGMQRFLKFTTTTWTHGDVPDSRQEQKN
ncbi:MAG: methyltransferase [Promethearchaeota archaeon CR_4]|nr:MAG: methyltransferase [Candidatus Lokiarchaeota archaeon CR_4]